MKTKQYLIFGSFFTLMSLSTFNSCKKDDTPAPSTTTNNTTNTGVTWTTVLNDDFQRANGTLGSNYTTQVACSGNGRDTLLNNEILFLGSGCWAINYTGSVPNSILKTSADFMIVNGTPSFGMTMKCTNLGSNWMYQEYYAFFVGSSGIAITKYLSDATHPPQSSPINDTLASKAFPILNNHVYNLKFTISNSSLKGYITDLSGTAKDSISGTDSGTLYTGSVVRLNGYNSGSNDSLTIDNIKIEKGN